MAILTVVVMVIKFDEGLPLVMPVFALASKNFTAVGPGTVLPAGTLTGYVMMVLSSTGLVQLPLQTVVGAVWIVEAVVDKVCAPAVNVVDVIVSFQPAPLPPDGVFATVRPSA